MNVVFITKVLIKSLISCWIRDNLEIFWMKSNYLGEKDELKPKRSVIIRENVSIDQEPTWSWLPTIEIRVAYYHAIDWSTLIFLAFLLVEIVSLLLPYFLALNPTWILTFYICSQTLFSFITYV